MLDVYLILHAASEGVNREVGKEFWAKYLNPFFLLLEVCEKMSDASNNTYSKNYPRIDALIARVSAVSNAGANCFIDTLMMF